MDRKEPKPTFDGSRWPLDARDSWRILLDLKVRGPAGHKRPCRLTLEPDGAPAVDGGGSPVAALGADGAVTVLAPVTPKARALLALHLDFVLAGPRRPSTLAHLGQSLDGQIATATGDACYINDAANIVHLHRLRALADAVVVGAGTVAADDPRLTTREVDGPDAVRVILDPHRRLSPGHRVFTDGAAPTLIVCLDHARGERLPGTVELASLQCSPEEFPRAVVALLHRRGLYRLFVEGGGRTVSAFLRAGVLDRLQITVAPVIVGTGIPGIAVPGVRRLRDALRPPAQRFPMGRDCLFDCRLQPTPADRGAPPSGN